MRSFGEASLYSSRLIRSGKYTEEELAAMNTEERVRIEENNIQSSIILFRQSCAKNSAYRRKKYKVLTKWQKAVRYCALV
jgi:hypothetical protein